TRVAPRFTIRADVGDGVGYAHGFTYAEAFVPVYQAPGEVLVFLDARGVNFDDARRWEWNAGGGVRMLIPCTEWVAGTNAFFDWRDTGNSTFRQVGMGFEAMGPLLE